MSCRDEYRHWPFLTDEEFTLACAFFDQRYVQAKLGPARKVLKIISRRTATTGGTYIEILRLLQPPKEDNDLALALESLGGFGRASAADTGMDVDMATDDDDQVSDLSVAFSIMFLGISRYYYYRMINVVLTRKQEVLRPQLWQNSNTHLPNYSLYAHQPYVTYEIHLHPTYRMPTLWFTLHDLPNGDATFDLDSVFRYLVPEDQKPRLREAGITGGISAAVSHFHYVH
jgi:ubiquitin-like-conjugating enzyme ATG10